MPAKQGRGCFFWVAMLGLGGLTLGACAFAPHVSAGTGTTMVIVWLVMEHFDQQARIRAELEELNARQRDDWRSGL